MLEHDMHSVEEKKLVFTTKIISWNFHTNHMLLSNFFHQSLLMSLLSTYKYLLLVFEPDSEQSIIDQWLPRISSGERRLPTKEDEGTSLDYGNVLYLDCDGG